MNPQKEIKQLLFKIAHPALDLEAVRALIYSLTLKDKAGKAVPMIIADTIALGPVLGITWSNVPGRLAYGVIDHSMLRIGIDSRIMTFLCRQVEQVRVCLLGLQQPTKLIDLFELCLHKLFLATEASRDLATEEPLTNAQRTALVEGLILASISQPELMQALFFRIARIFSMREKQEFFSRLHDTIQSGLQNIPWDDQDKDVKICSDLDGPIRFRKTLVEDPAFLETAEKLPRYFMETVLN